MDVRIKVGASLDASVSSVFGSFEAAAQRARKNVENEMAGIGTALGRVGPPARAAGAEVERGLGGATRGAKRAKESFEEVSSSAAMGFGRAIREAKKLPPSMAAVAREVERESKRIAAANARASLGLGGKSGFSVAASFINPRIRTSIPNPWNAALHGGRRLAAPARAGPAAGQICDRLGA